MNFDAVGVITRSGFEPNCLHARPNPSGCTHNATLRWFNT